jgi:hypothetical protein
VVGHDVSPSKRFCFFILPLFSGMAGQCDTLTGGPAFRPGPVLAVQSVGSSPRLS